MAEDSLERQTEIVFICTANVCRSIMAHAICAGEIRKRGLKLSVSSAGLLDFDGVLIADNARIACQRHQTWLPKFAATHISKLDLTNAKIALVMEKNHVSALLRMGLLPRERIAMLGEFDPRQRGVEIDDPMGEDLDAFQRCYERLRECICHFLDTSGAF